MDRKFNLAIVTRTRERLLLLERAIDSLDAQSNQDFVHVIVNDGGNRAELESFLKTKPRQDRVVLHNTESAGLVAALNQGLKAVDSEYVSILDDDDTWHPERAAKVIDYLSSKPEVGAVIVKMDTIVEDVISDKVNKIDQYPHPDGGGSQVSLYLQCHRNYLSNGVITYSRKLYDDLGGYDESLATAEDWDFGIRMMLKTDVDVVPSDGALFYYHQRPNQTGSQGNSVHARAKEQEYVINKIRNKFLRSDIEKGVSGVGLIMNMTEQDMVNVVRLEGHVNRGVETIDAQLVKLDDAVQSSTRPAASKIKDKIVHKFHSKS